MAGAKINGSNNKKKMKNLVVFECNGPQMSTLVDKINRLFAPRSSRVILTASSSIDADDDSSDKERSQEESVESLPLQRASTLHRIGLAEYARLYGANEKINVRIEIESNVALDIAHRMPSVDWCDARLRLRPFLEQTKGTNMYARIVASANQLRSAIVFCGERCNWRQMIERSPRPTYHFQTMFRHSIAPAYLPLVLLKCSDQIVRLSKWSANSSIYHLETWFGSLLEVTPYGVSDATLYAYDADIGFVAPYQVEPTDLPHSLHAWQKQVEKGTLCPSAL